MFGLGGGIYAGSAYTPVSATVSRWFAERRTLALGIALIGIVAGQMVLSPVSSAVIDARGWRTAYLVLGCVAFACALPALFLLRRPAGAATTGREAPGARPELTGLSVRQAARTAPFWMLMVTGFVISVGFYMMAAHIVPYATDEGVANTTAALIMTISSVGGIAGSLSAWAISKRLGPKQALAAFLVGEGVALFLFLATRSAWSFVVVAMVWSFTFSCASPARMAMAAPLFGLRSVGSILGIATLAFSLGGIAGPFLGGYIYDRRGSYSLALIVAGVLLFAGAATAYLFGGRRKQPEPGAIVKEFA